MTQTRRIGGALWSLRHVPAPASRCNSCLWLLEIVHAGVVEPSEHFLRRLHRPKHNWRYVVVIEATYAVPTVSGIMRSMPDGKLEMTHLNRPISTHTRHHLESSTAHTWPTPQPRLQQLIHPEILLALCPPPPSARPYRHLLLGSLIPSQDSVGQGKLAPWYRYSSRAG
jgi:hypothetical protein